MGISGGRRLGIWQTSSRDLCGTSVGCLSGGHGQGIWQTSSRYLRGTSAGCLVDVCVTSRPRRFLEVKLMSAGCSTDAPSTLYHKSVDSNEGKGLSGPPSSDLVSVTCPVDV